MSFESLQGGGGILLRGHGGGERGRGHFFWRCGGFGGGTLFVRVQFLLLFLCLFQELGRAGDFSLGCSRHQMS